MASIPFAGGAQAAPRPQVRSGSPAPWRYVDDARTHEVYAGFARDPPAFVVREMAHGLRDPSCVVTTSSPISATWEGRLHVMELEARLAMLGSYWRYDMQAGGPPVRLRSLQSAADLRSVVPALAPVGAQLYHFHHRAMRRDVVLAETSSPTGAGRALARLTLRGAEIGGAEFRVIVADAAAPVSRSLLAREHLALRVRGYEKLVAERDFERAHPGAWRDATQECYRQLLDELRQPPEDRSIEAPASSESGYTDFVRALADPRLTALHARFLAPGEEAALMRGGEPFIRRAIQLRRAKASNDDQLLLNVLEASLLARFGLGTGERAHVDPEVSALVRRFAFYL